MNTNIKKIFVAFLVLGVIFPRLPLGRANHNIGDLNSITYVNWKNEVFQNTFVKNFYLTFNNLDFSTKLKNQLEYTFFNNSKLENLIIGNDGNVFLKTDFESFKGLNSIGENNVILQLKKLQYVSDRLSQDNKKLVIAITPSKSIINNHLLNKEVDQNSNYSLFSKHLASFKLNLIDFNKHYCNEGTKNTLFNQSNILFNKTTSINILDSTLKFTSKILNTKLKNISIESLTEVEDTSGFANPLNLLFVKKSTSEVAEVSYSKDSKLDQSVILIGDESSKSIYETNFMSEIFSGGTYCLNGKEMINDKTPNDISSFDNNIILSELKNSKVLMIVIDPSNLDNFAFGTINFLYNYYSPEGGINDEYSEYERECEAERQKILSNEEHKRLVQNQSKSLNRNFYDNLRGHVEYSLSLQNRSWITESDKFTEFQAQSILIKNNILKDSKKKKEILDSAKLNNWSTEFSLNHFSRKTIESNNINGYISVRDSISPLHLAILNIENKILLDSPWTKLVNEQAKEKGISFNQSLYDNAKYMLFIKYEPYYNSLDEGKRWVNDLYYTNEIKKKDNWLIHIDKLSSSQKKSKEEIIKENMLFLSYINRVRPLDLNIDEIWTIQQELNIRNDSAWFDKIKIEAEQKKISTQSNLREHASYMYFLQKGNGA
jgi:hypothetical protein